MRVPRDEPQVAGQQSRRWAGGVRYGAEPYGPAEGPAPAANHREGRRRDQAWLGVLVPTLALALAGLLGGVLWAWWAEPAAYTVTPRATFLDEEQLGRVFGVEARYAMVGLVGGFVVAVATSTWLRRAGWLLVVGMAVGGAAAAVLSYALGVRLGPGPVEQAATNSSPGDSLAAPLEVQTYGFFLAWVVGALAGLLLAMIATDRSPTDSTVLGLADLSRR